MYYAFFDPTGRRSGYLLRNPGAQSPPFGRSHDPGHVHGFDVPAVLSIHGILRWRSQSHRFRKTAVVGHASATLLLLAVLLFFAKIHAHQV